MARIPLSIISIISLALILCLNQAEGVPNNRILGGENAGSNDFPYVASVRVDMVHSCGGTIIGSKAILTAAHCVHDKKASKVIAASRLSVRLGSTNQYAGGSIFQIDGVILHPDYDGLKNDLAILKLSEDLTWTDRIESIAFAKSAAEEPSVDESVLVAGWGQREDGNAPYKLQTTTFKVAKEEDCLDGYSDSDDSTVCLANGSCYGDAGNGAVYNDVLVAVSNFIVGACGALYPDVYANVSYFADWIQQNIE